ncbi:phage Tail Protein X [Burkholderia pseudomallei]|uniref:tail protein X n=1 Tax=pseudomallei group TaxID=111527 RepID=UPI00039C724D|nr:MULTISPECIES: tail protein X [pseudomallei group]AVR10981.1 phage tail protein [Burkholderia thailandensis]KIS58850.1 phage Tail Protein X family protein [Burkholderia thailandensis Phuket 4W-1]KIX54271.1 phage tail protein [Burkholderia pseudomallei]MBF3456221.1 tail protein X [Burkholderia pseudomallei]MBF3480033.1 tail protein X [Burkholderia pseudomallei]
MARTLRTSDGDVLDTLCHAAYGTLSGAVEAVYEANPGLAREPQPFRSGVLITLPDLDAPRDEPIQLWS